jgi:putative ABC transport system permease protein
MGLVCFQESKFENRKKRKSKYMILKLASRNLIGRGMRTVLNATVLSLAFVAIIMIQGLLLGMNQQIADAVTKTEYGGGQLWYKKYDPYDMYSLKDAHGTIPTQLAEARKQGLVSPILIVQGFIYPNGRMRPALIKGIEPFQKIIAIPSRFLVDSNAALPIMVGNRMAKNSCLKICDVMTIQWKDVHGRIDARDATVVQIMNTTVPTVDNGQIWMPLEQLQELMDMPNQATLIVKKASYAIPENIPGWIYRDLDFLLKDVNEMIKAKSVSSGLVYMLLIFLAMLAIYDTQVLSIFHRRKEMGTLMALGLTRFKLIQLFTLEGTLNGVMAVILAYVYGFPLFLILSKTGINIPSNADSYGFAIGEKLFPVYPPTLIISTTVLVLIITAIVSFIPTRSIARLKPTDALKGITT